MRFPPSRLAQKEWDTHGNTEAAYMNHQITGALTVILDFEPELTNYGPNGGALFPTPDTPPRYESQKSRTVGFPCTILKLPVLGISPAIQRRVVAWVWIDSVTVNAWHFCKRRS